MCFESKLIEKVLKKVKKATFAAADLEVQRLMMLLKLFTIQLVRIIAVAVEKILRGNAVLPLTFARITILRLWKR